MIEAVLLKLQQPKTLRALAQKSNIPHSTLWRLANCKAVSGGKTQTGSLQTLLKLDKAGFFNDMMTDQERAVRNYLKAIPQKEFMFDPHLRQIRDLLGTNGEST